MALCRSRRARLDHVQLRQLTKLKEMITEVMPARSPLGDTKESRTLQQALRNRSPLSSTPFLPYLATTGSGASCP
jgi:hypothetical protein